VAPYLSASLFLRFRCDGEGAVPLPLYAQYLTQHSNVLRLVSGRRGAGLVVVSGACRLPADSITAMAA
jgi:hypothetical protein